MITLNRDQVLNDLRESVIAVHFTKANGDARVLRGTLRRDLLPPTYKTEETQERSYHKENPEVVACWDCDKRAWRSFRIDSVEYVEDVTEKYV